MAVIYLVGSTVEHMLVGDRTGCEKIVFFETLLKENWQPLDYSDLELTLKPDSIRFEINFKTSFQLAANRLYQFVAESLYDSHVVASTVSEMISLTVRVSAIDYY